MPPRRRRSTRRSKRACDAGIVVISFSAVVTEPCAYKLNTNWEHVNHDLPVWLAEVLGGKGKIIVDRGLPGSRSPSRRTRRSTMSWPSTPTSRSSAEYISNYALGDEQAGVAACSPRTRRSTAS